MIVSAICAEIPNRANAKLKVKAARIIRKIIPVVRIVDIIALTTISQLVFNVALHTAQSGIL